jgi:hypothetical protein
VTPTFRRISAKITLSEGSTLFHGWEEKLMKKLGPVVSTGKPIRIFLYMD